jgi:hypothetical protein
MLAAASHSLIGMHKFHAKVEHEKNRLAVMAGDDDTYQQLLGIAHKTGRDYGFVANCYAQGVSVNVVAGMCKYGIERLPEMKKT